MFLKIVQVNLSSDSYHHKLNYNFIDPLKDLYTKYGIEAESYIFIRPDTHIQSLGKLNKTQDIKILIQEFLIKLLSQVA